MSKSIEDQAFKYAIKNAALHNGKADVGAVTGKLKALFPEEDIKQVARISGAAVQEINSMPISEIENRFAAFEQGEGFELKPKEKEKGLAALDWAEKGEKVVTRFAPNPNGPMHIGHCRPAVLCAQYAKKYSGKFLLRFEDTDPKVKKPMENAEKLFLEDLKWLGYKPDSISWASNRFERYYEYMQKAISLGKAYVCSCDNDEFKKLKNKAIACPHREKKTDWQLAEFKKMLSHQYKEGEAVLRIKTVLDHPDLSVRDWWAAKIVDRVEYSRLKNRVVFPSFNFQNAVDDHEEGVSLIIRGVQHTQNAVKQKFLYGYFGWTFPHIIHFGLIKVKGVVLSKSRIAELMKNDASFMGYSDPRLGTVCAFREKGFRPDVLVDEMMELGTRPNDALVSIEKLESKNRDAIDKDSNRFILVEQAVEVVVNNAPKKMVELENYPGDASKGVRKYSLPANKAVFWIDSPEAQNAKLGSVFRLKHAYNVRVVKKDGKKIDCEFVSEEHKTGIPIVNWLRPEEKQSVSIRMLDAKLVSGQTEMAIAREKIGSHVRFEDFGFCVVKKQEKGKTQLNYTHA